MSQQSDIEWTDATWNPVRGCTKVSPGCANCYAETFAERWLGVPGHAYEQGFDLRLVPEKLMEPLKWKEPRRVFVNSMSDLFQDGVPDEFIDKAFAIMAFTQRHTFQLLTKRAERMRAYMNDPLRFANVLEAYSRTVPRRANRPTIEKWPLPNVWLGVSVENQHFANERIPLLIKTPAAVRFISAEPLLGPVEMNDWLHRWRVRPGLACHAYRSEPAEETTPRLDWVIVGGESGSGARPFDLAWARSIVVQCRDAGVPLFVKQLGAVPTMDESAWRALPSMPLLNHRNHRKAPAGTVPLKFASKKAGSPAEWPADLRVREFPEARA